MSDPPPPPRARPVRTPSPPAEGAEHPALRAIPPSSFREHLEREHGLAVIAEPGWPTEIRRYFLVRGQNGTQRQLASHRGTLGAAVTHFYYLLHPEQRPRR